MIFAHNERQRELALLSQQSIDAEFDWKNVTPVEALRNFYAAEEYHQDYYLKNPVRYKYYRYRCGRDARLDRVWDTSNLRQ